ncbi:MAG TPA: LptF/LptG family permease [Phycisphaeraceae bacterium]
MKILDRYIIRHFLINFGILLTVLMLLYVLVDLIIDLDEFLQAGRLHAQSYGGVLPATLVSIADYYGPMIVLLYVFFSGLLVVGAAGFTLSLLLRSRELTAMVASGMSLYRVAAPILLVGILLNALSLPVQELVIPRLAPKLARSKSQVKHGAAVSFQVMFTPDEQGRLFSAATFDAAGGELIGVSILERDDRGMVLRRIQAERAIWDADRQGWRLYPLGYAVRPQLALDDVPDALAPHDPEPVEFIATELSPAALLAKQASIYPRLLSLRTLQGLQESPVLDSGQRQMVTKVIWSRLSLLVLGALVLVMGLSFFLQLGQMSLLVQAAKAAAVCLGAWGSGLVMLQIGSDVLNPVTVAWLPVVLYLPMSALLLQGVKT